MRRWRLRIDKAGRIVIPRSLRGDTLALESHGATITLRPTALLKKEKGVWVYQGEPTRASIPDLIDKEREKRLREWTG